MNIHVHVRVLLWMLCPLMMSDDDVALGKRMILCLRNYEMMCYMWNEEERCWKCLKCCNGKEMEDEKEKRNEML